MSSPISLPITGSNFWTNVKDLQLYKDGGIYYICFTDSAVMQIVLRDKEELFEDTVRRESRNLNFNVIVNGNFYDVTPSGKFDAAIGHDPIPAAETTPIGFLINNFKLIGGKADPNRFYVANVPGTTYGYKFGFGDPPRNVVAAIGGAGPLIINGLKYGIGNQYKSGTSSGAPTTGSPSATDMPNLTQRNNNTYAAAASRHPATGKTVIAHSSSARKLMVLVQPNAVTSGIPLDDLRDKLDSVGIDNAVFLDGSDSSMLMVNNVLHSRQGPNKDETNTVGVGFIIY
jgi:hypothetical protein